MRLGDVAELPPGEPLHVTNGEGAMPTPPPRGDYDAFTRVLLVLTNEGRAVVGAGADAATGSGSGLRA